MKEKVMTQRSLTRRQVLRGSLVVAGAATLAACGATPAPQIVEKVVTSVVEREVTKIVAGTPQVVKETVVVQQTVVVEGPTAAPVAKGAVDIDYWYIWGGDGGKAMEQVSAEFEKRQNGAVKMHPLAAGGSILDKTIAAYAAGAPPSIVDLILCAPLAARGALVTLDDYIATSTVFKSDNYYDAQWDGTKWAGRKWGIPANEGLGWLGLFSNDQIVQEAGLDPKSPPKTYDDLFTWSEAMTKRDGSKLSQLGYFPGTGGMMGYPDVASVVSAQHYFDGDALKYSLTSEPILNIYRQEKRFQDSYGAQNISDFSAGFSGQPIADPVNAGKVGMWTSGSWDPGTRTLNAAKGMTWSVNYMVDGAGKGDKPFFAGTHVMMLLKGGHATEAWPFLEWSCTDERNKMVFDTCGFIMGTKSFIASLDMTKAFHGLDFFTKGLSEGTRIYGLAPDPNWYTVLDGMYAAFDAVGFGKQTPEDAMKALEAKVTDELNKLINR
jgi:ABC-type glycerol-3-phosphate transport system substrate-binding protein